MCRVLKNITLTHENSKTGFWGPILISIGTISSEILQWRRVSVALNRRAKLEVSGGKFAKRLDEFFIDLTLYRRVVGSGEDKTWFIIGLEVNCE